MDVTLPIRPQQSQEEARSHQNVNPELRQGIVRASREESKASEREVSISCHLFWVNPAQVPFDVLDSVVRRGYIDGIIVLFDAHTYLDIIPKLTRLLSYSSLIRTLKLFSDELPLQPMLPFYNFPNVLDSLPARMNALVNLHIATQYRHLHFDVIAKVLIRARNLKALKLEGPRIIYHEERPERQWFRYFACKLEALILKFCSLKNHTLENILSKSGQSLKSFHLEHCWELEREKTASLITLYIPNCEAITVIMPRIEAIEDNNVPLTNVLTVALRAPVLSCQVLFCQGLCISDEALMLSGNRRGNFRTVLPSLQKLIFHDCDNLSVEAVTFAILNKKFPRLYLLEAMWGRPASDDQIAVEAERRRMLMLFNACLQAKITASEGMHKYYADILLPAELDQKHQLEQHNQAAAEAARAAEEAKAQQQKARAEQMVNQDRLEVVQGLQKPGPAGFFDGR